MDYITILGLVAGALTTTSLLPQIIKTWKSKSTKDISLGMFIISFTGTLLWLVYGIYVNSLPVIVANAVSFILVSIMLTFKIKYK